MKDAINELSTAGLENNETSKSSIEIKGTKAKIITCSMYRLKDNETKNFRYFVQEHFTKEHKKSRNASETKRGKYKTVKLAVEILNDQVVDKPMVLGHLWKRGNESDPIPNDITQDGEACAIRSSTSKKNRGTGGNPRSSQYKIGLCSPKGAQH